MITGTLLYTWYRVVSNLKVLVSTLHTPQRVRLLTESHHYLVACLTDVSHVRAETECSCKLSHACTINRGTD